MTQRGPAQGFDGIPVAQLETASGAVLRAWPSRGDASEATGVHPNGISNVIKGRAKSAGGFGWRFARGEDGAGRVATIGDCAREARARVVEPTGKRFVDEGRTWQVCAPASRLSGEGGG